MEENWKIVYYESLEGNIPVFDFIQNLDVRVQNKISDLLDLLKEFGTRLGPPHSKKVIGTSLWELRILESENIRIFYVAIVNQNFLLLHAFSKKKQKTDKKEIKTAISRLNEYKSRQKMIS